jgi:hypothetical protein
MLVALNKKSAQKQKLKTVTTASRKPLFHKTNSPKHAKPKAKLTH